MQIKTTAFPRLPWLDAASWLSDARDALILRPGTMPSSPSGRSWRWSPLSRWRGRRRAEPSLDGGYTALRIGTIVVLGGAVAHAATTSRVGERAVAGAVLVFFAASLAAISLARLRLEAGRGALPRGGRWLATFLAPILAVVVAAVTAAGISRARSHDRLGAFAADLGIDDSLSPLRPDRGRDRLRDRLADPLAPFRPRIAHDPADRHTRSRASAPRAYNARSSARPRFPTRSAI